MVHLNVMKSLPLLLFHIANFVLSWWFHFVNFVLSWLLHVVNFVSSWLFHFIIFVPFWQFQPIIFPQRISLWWKNFPAGDKFIKYFYYPALKTNKVIYQRTKKQPTSNFLLLKDKFYGRKIKVGIFSLLLGHYKKENNICGLVEWRS